MRLKVPYFYDNKGKNVAFHHPKSLLTRSFIKIFLLAILSPILFCYIILSSSNFLLFMDFEIVVKFHAFHWEFGGQMGFRNDSEPSGSSKP